MDSVDPQSPSAGDNELLKRARRLRESPEPGPRQAGYGLPCARCKTYYAADLRECPVCRSPQRVSPVKPLAAHTPAGQLSDPSSKLEEEREPLLDEFKAALARDAPLPAAHCHRWEKHSNRPAPATICQSCYDELRQRVDVLEAAMHMDLREAAQIVYDAVWADTSDPRRTYQNAARALLIELRRRSAIRQRFGQLEPPTN